MQCPLSHGSVRKPEFRCRNYAVTGETELKSVGIGAGFGAGASKRQKGQNKRVTEWEPSEWNSEWNVIVELHINI